MTTRPDDLLLRLENVGKRYSGNADLAVRSVDLDIAKGEFVSLLGPSGSGKTTTLMMIAGFELPSEGRILLAGRDIISAPAHRRNFGMVFQNYALFPHMTVFQNVAYPLQLRKVADGDMEKAVARYLDMVGLGSLANRRPAALSGGQQQRVALARALVFEPSVVLMDEPLGALDKNLREQLQIEIKELQKALGITLIYVTHDQSEAMTMSDRIAVFRQGRIDQIAPPIELYNRPATRFVGEFVGESNMIEGRLDASGRPLMHSDFGEIDFAGKMPLRPGDAAIAMIRPEFIKLVQQPAARNGSRLTVTRTINFGDRVTIEGHVAGGQPIRLRTSAREAAGCAPGNEIEIAWQADDVHILVPGA